MTLPALPLPLANQPNIAYSGRPNMTQGTETTPRNAGERLADEIQFEVESLAMLPGSVIASERDLRATHQAGRSVLQQAVRILEDRGVVKMRRGQSGGLVVQQPGPEAAARTLAILIESDLDIASDVRDLLQASDNQVFTRDLAHLSLDECRDLRALALHLDSLPSDEFAHAFGHRTLIHAIRRAIPDPALALAQWTCLECGTDLTPARPHAVGERTRSEFWTLQVQSIEAMIARDVSRLFEIRLRQYRIMDDSAEEWPLDRLDKEFTRTGKDYAQYSSPTSRADMLTREILRDARAVRWQEGARLGGAEDLMQRYGVSLLVLRQAVRVLEESGAVRMQRGRYGGLFVARPNRETAIARGLRHLKAAQVSHANTREFLIELLLTCLKRARGRATLATLGKLGEVIVAIRGPFLSNPAETRSLTGAIADLASNPALAAFVEITAQCAEPDQPDRTRFPQAPAPLIEMHRALVERDSAFARRAFLQYSLGDPDPTAQRGIDARPAGPAAHRPS